MATVMSLHVGARFPLVATLVTITVFSILFTLCSGQTQGSSDGPASVAPSKPKTPKPNPTTIRQKTVQPQTVVTLVLDPVPDKPKTAKTTSKPVTKPVAITVGPTRKPTSQNDMKPASQNGAKPNDHDDHHGEEELPFCEANERAAIRRECPHEDDDLLWFFLSLFLIIAWGAFVRTILRITKISVPYTVILMITGLLLGTGTHFQRKPGDTCICSFWSKFTKIARIPPKIILYTFLPALIFESAFAMDVHVFKRSLSQILIIALPGMLISVTLTGFFCTGFMTTYNWSYPTSFMFGSIISATDPVAVVAILKELGTSKKLSTLIEGESLLNDGIAVLLFEIFSQVVTGEQKLMLEIIWTMVKIGIGGPVFGYITGKICSMSLARIFNDAATEITITIFSSYLVYWIAEELEISGVISVLVLGLKISAESTSISPEVGKLVHHFWDMVGYLANTVLFVLVGIILSETAIGQIHPLDWFNLFFLYFNLNIIRLATLMLLMPVLSRVGYGLKWQDMVICMWGGLRGAVGLCLSLEVYYSSEICKTPEDQVGPKFLFHTAGIVFLTLSVNGTTTKAVLDALHLTDVSPGRLQDMSNAVKQIAGARARAILQYRHDRSLSDASWSSVKSYTQIHDPYKKDKRKQRKRRRASEDRTEMRVLPLPEPHHHSYHVDNDSMIGSVSHLNLFPEYSSQRVVDVTAEYSRRRASSIIRMENEDTIQVEESRQRILKALKVSFWRQYDIGVLSDVAVKVLVGVADAAGDVSLHMIQAEDLKGYFVVHGFFHWFREYIIQPLHLDAPPVLPKKPVARWRHKFWWLATREWFNVLITAIVFLSMVPALWEFILDVQYAEQDISMRARIAFLVISFMFTGIYMLEFLIKIIGYGIRGYFKDKWNWLDILILVVGIVNACYSLLYIISPENVSAQSNSASSGLSIVTRMFRFAKIVRSLRLLKCAVERSTNFMDRKVNASVFLGYDIGKGFVKAVDDVIKFLPQMVEHEKILRPLERALRTQRLETTRLLGLLQEKHPTIATAVKTRHAARAIMNDLRATVLELEEDGLLEHTESNALMAIIESKMKSLGSTPVSIQPNSAEGILMNCVWLQASNPEMRAYFKSISVFKEFMAGDVIASVGDKPNGIYVIVRGMVKVMFEPTISIIHDQAEFGQLPNVEVLGDMRFSNEDTDYLQVGCTIGEIGTLTDLPNACTISCETPVTVYHIPQADLKLGLSMFEGNDDSLESRLWRSVGMRVATVLLPDEPEYQSWTVDRIRVRVEQSGVPIGAQFENMVLPDFVCDIVLIQGQIMDGTSKEVFTAPTLLPRNCKKLSKVPEPKIPARFLVITDDDLDLEEEVSDVIGYSQTDMVVAKALVGSVVKTSRAYSEFSIPEEFQTRGPQWTVLQKLNTHQ